MVAVAKVPGVLLSFHAAQQFEVEIKFDGKPIFNQEVQICAYHEQCIYIYPILIKTEDPFKIFNIMLILVLVLKSSFSPTPTKMMQMSVTFHILKMFLDFLTDRQTDGQCDVMK